MPRRAPFEESGPNGETRTRVPGQFSIPKKQQPSALAGVFETPELCTMIVNKIAHRWEDIANLSRTCQTILCGINHVTVSYSDILDHQEEN